MCSPFWVSFFREINWQSAKIYQHIARLSDKLRQWGNQLWPCRCVRLPPVPPAPPASPHPPVPFPNSPQRRGAWERLGGSNAVHLFIYLSRSFISRYKWPWRLTTTESPTPPPLAQTRLVCEEGVIIIKNTQIREEQWILLQAGEGDGGDIFFFPSLFGGGVLCMSQLGTQFTGW